jgi:hypothetical protein
MTLIGRIGGDFAGSCDFKALFGAAFGFQFGHLILEWFFRLRLAGHARECYNSPASAQHRDCLLIKNRLHLQGILLNPPLNPSKSKTVYLIVYLLIIVMAKPTPEQLAAALRQNLRRRKKGEGATSSSSPTTPASTDQTSPSQQRRS